MNIEQKPVRPSFMRRLYNAANDYSYRFKLILRSKKRYREAMEKSGKKVMLTYPQRPRALHSLYEISHALGLTLTNDPNVPVDIIMHFEDTTVRPENPTLARLAKGKKVINGRCFDIGKAHVEKVFQEVFGYGMEIDPEKHVGPAVRKSNTNAVHDGKVIKCPTPREDGYIYQKLINNIKGDKVIDLRVSIFGDLIPLLYVRHKHTFDRFDNTLYSVRVPVADYITVDEQKKITEFCQKFGLDYGELDVLRDKDDGRLYIVDVNNTPYGPRSEVHVPPDEYEKFIQLSSEAFKKAFLQ